MFSVVKGEAMGYKVVVGIGLRRISPFTRQFSGPLFFNFNVVICIRVHFCRLTSAV